MLDNTPLTQPSDPRVTKAMQLLMKYWGLKVPKAMLALGINCLDSMAPNKQMWVCCYLQEAVLHALKESLPLEIIMVSYIKNKTLVKVTLYNRPYI